MVPEHFIVTSKLHLPIVHLSVGWFLVDWQGLLVLFCLLFIILFLTRFHSVVLAELELTM